MKILMKDLKHGKVKVAVENMDDFWYLSQIINQGDLVEGLSTRKIKIGDKQESVKKTVFVKISVEKVEFQKYSSMLKILGTTVDEADEIPKGSYHSINIEENSIISIIKDEWMNYELNLLEESSKGLQKKILMVALDKETCLLAWLKKDSYEIITEIHGTSGKRYDNAERKDFFEEIAKLLLQYKDKSDHIIIASPAFWKDEMMKILKDKDIIKKVITCNCSSATISGLNEVLKSNELRKALKEERASKEAELVDNLEKEIAKDGKYSYGIDETEKASEAGAINELIVTENFIMKKRQEENFIRLEKIMKNVDKTKGKVHIISSDHDAGKKLDGLGGIGAILRYKLF